jgi:hypothetical protein
MREIQRLPTALYEYHLNELGFINVHCDTWNNKGEKYQILRCRLIWGLLPALSPGQACVSVTQRVERLREKDGEGAVFAVSADGGDGWEDPS